MSKALRYRLFGIGKMPAPLKDVAAGSGVLVAAEGVSVKESVRLLEIPRASVKAGTKLLVGAVVVRPDRLVASIGAHPVLDTDFRDSDRDDPQLTLAADGIRITFDIAQVLDGGSGSIEVHYRLAFDAVVLVQLPSVSCRVSLSNVSPTLLNGWKGMKAR